MQRGLQRVFLQVTGHGGAGGPHFQVLLLGVVKAMFDELVGNAFAPVLFLNKGMLEINHLRFRQGIGQFAYFIFVKAGGKLLVLLVMPNIYLHFTGNRNKK
jgi:hypothetical protein